MNGATWWMLPEHRWQAERQQEAADSEAVARIGRGTLVEALSGGKDSGALALYLRETGLENAHMEVGGDVIRYSQDTGWELPETYRYMADLADYFGPIQHCATWVPGPGEVRPADAGPYVAGMRAGPTYWVNYWKTPGTVMDATAHEMVLDFEERLGHYSAFLRLIANRASFVPTQQRWCSRTMKTDVARQFLASLDDPWTVAGIRAEESEPRAATAPWGWSDHHDAWAYSPIKWWSYEDVIAIHNRHGIAPNPLYLQGQGAGRVGCGPCIYSNRRDLRWMIGSQKKRLELLADFERAIAKLPQAARHHDRGSPSPTWFTMEDRPPKVRGQKQEKGKEVCTPLDEVLFWAKAERGGKQMALFLGGGERPGCSAWSLCEVPQKDAA